MRVAILGTGGMGSALAERLLATGNDVTVWNRTAGRTKALVARGATAASSPVEAARNAEAVLLSLADDEAVREVALRSGLAESLGNAVLVDTSTVAPSTSRELARACPRGKMLAAPILSAPQGVVAGKAPLLLGGPAETIASLAPLWQALGGPTRHCGDDPGLATTHKLVSNYLLMSGLVTLSEAIALGQAAGIADAALRDFLGASVMVPAGLHNRLDDLLGGDHRGWFTTVLGAKDVRLAKELGASLGLSLPAAELVERRYEEAAKSGFRDADIAAVVELTRRRG